MQNHISKQAICKINWQCFLAEILWLWPAACMHIYSPYFHACFSWNLVPSFPQKGKKRERERNQVPSQCCRLHLVPAISSGVFQSFSLALWPTAAWADSRQAAVVSCEKCGACCFVCCLPCLYNLRTRLSPGLGLTGNVLIDKSGLYPSAADV